MNKLLFLFGICLLPTLGFSQKIASPAKPLVFVTSAMYPPFEYRDYNDLTGFDIALAQALAKELGRKAEFIDTQFGAVLPMLKNGQADAAIATLTITAERQQNLDFSQPYYFESIAVVYPKQHPINQINDLGKKKIACQLGSTMEFWLQQTTPNANKVSMDTNNQSIAALKAGLVDAVLTDGAQSVIYAKQNPNLAYQIIAQSPDGYGIAVNKGSPLLNEINHALQKLEADGTLKKLQQQWLGEES